MSQILLATILLNRTLMHMHREGHHSTPPGLRLLLRFGLLGALLLLATSCAGGGPDGAISSVPEDVEDPPEIVGGEDALYQKLEYPEIAHAARVQGAVVVRAVVDADGEATQVDVVQGIHDVLDQEARRVVQEMTFKPGYQNGMPVRAQVKVPVRFELDENNHPVHGKAAPAELPETATGPFDRPPRLIGGLMALQQEVRYPREAKKKEIAGKVYVRCVVSEEGVPKGVHVTQPVHPLLDIESVRVVREMRFEPAIKDGENVPVQMTLPVTFRMR